MDATPSGSRTTRRAFVKTAGALGSWSAGGGRNIRPGGAGQESGAGAERGTEGGHGGGGGRDEVVLYGREIGLVSELLKVPARPWPSLRKPGKPTMNARM